MAFFHHYIYGKFVIDINFRGEKCVNNLFSEDRGKIKAGYPN
jgi:hypothetical protein